MTFHRHDSKDCLCIKYKPDFTTADLRLTGENFYCGGCNRYVSSKKWKGGIIHFGSRSRYAKFFECPCCGYRMRYKRRGKKKIIDSIENQTKHPEEYTEYVLSKLKMKQDLLEKNILLPTVR